MRTLTCLGGLVVAATFLLAGCEEPPPATSTITRSANQEDDEPELDCEPDSEEECECSNGDEGNKYCHDDGTWGECFCGEEEEDAGPPTFSSDCKPGRYEGEFFGMYNSAFSPLPIPVWAFNISGMPGLAFTLNAKGEECFEGAEFCNQLEISDGYVKGTADGLFPFEGKLTGTLNCETKEFNATLDGGYALLFEGLFFNEAKFKGPVLGIYDVDSASFPCEKDNPKFPKCELDAPILATNVVADIVAASAFPKPENPSYWDLEETEISIPLFPSTIPQGHGGSGYWWAIHVGEGSVDPNTGMATP